jgi:hypothetical protein
MSSEPVNMLHVALHGKKDFVDVIEVMNLEIMRESLI